MANAHLRNRTFVAGDEPQQGAFARTHIHGDPPERSGLFCRDQMRGRQRDARLAHHREARDGRVDELVTFRVEGERSHGIEVSLSLIRDCDHHLVFWRRGSGRCFGGHLRRRRWLRRSRGLTGVGDLDSDDEGKSNQHQPDGLAAAIGLLVHLGSFLVC